jgi:hypothetical protein
LALVLWVGDQDLATVPAGATMITKTCTPVSGGKGFVIMKVRYPILRDHELPGQGGVWGRSLQANTVRNF